MNMPTSFMRPPFGFAFFCVSSVAQITDYIDRITQRKVARVTIGQIYSGAVPFVLLQIVMIALVIAFPGLVIGGLDKTIQVDTAKVFEQLQN